MNTKNIKIRTQIMLGFVTMLLFVIGLGVVNYQQTNKIHLETETIYNHPLRVSGAIGTLNFDILSMRLGTRDLMLANSNAEKEEAIRLIEKSSIDAHEQFKILNSKYLGPRTDIDEAYKAFINWKIAREENTRQVLSGEIEKVKESILPTGTVGSLREQLMAKIKVIDDVAYNTADEIYINSQKLENSLNNKLMLLVACIVLISGIVIYFVIRNISNPINELTDAARRFHSGDRNARSLYTKRNEFGVLSDSFNILVESIQVNAELNEKVVSLASLMLSKYEAKEFFRETLNALASHTSSQMAAVYLLSDDKQTFEHFESLGLDINARQSFDARSQEGEFGPAISSHQVQHIKNIDADTRFIFHTVSGKFIPHEIITIPILTNNEVVAIISLASVSKYSNQSIQLIDSIFVTLRARVEGIIAYHKMRKFSELLEQQNRELEVQKTSLASQSAELTAQNTELEMQKKQLSEANQLKTNFLSNMSHELRTPLNSVIALSGVLSRRLVKLIPDEELSYLEVIERNGRHLLTLINDILDISRIEAGREEIEITKFNVNRLVDEIVSMIMPLAKQKNIELAQTSITPNLYITSDFAKCRHILQNLIANAVKFTEKGKVEVQSQQDGTEIRISVTDTGIGISESHQSHIFDEFRQADSSTSRKFGGTGLGLAIAKKYANLLGGTISVKSTTDEGSEFTLTLPFLFETENRIVDAMLFPEKAVTVQPAAELQITREKPVVLVVEDNPDNMITVKAILSGNFTIIEAVNGLEGLGMAKKCRPNLILMDIALPELDGIDTFKAIRRDSALQNIPVIALTASAMTSDREAILSYGFNAYIAKPIDEKLFFITINEVLYGK